MLKHCQSFSDRNTRGLAFRTCINGKKQWRHRRNTTIKKHRDIQFAVGDTVFAEYSEFEIQGHSAQAVAEVFAALTRFLERIGAQAYRLKLPDTWRIHPVFYVSLLKQWRPSTV